MQIKPPNYFILFFSLVIFGCASQQVENTPIKADTVIVKPHCYNDAAKEMLRWNKVNGKELKGLTRRRQEEMKFFLKDCEK
jgi:hypothetical protein